MEQRIGFCTTPDGTRLAYSTVGQGPPIVYLGPCVSHLELEWEHPDWRAFFEKLTHSRMLVRYDRRGSGLSDRKESDFSLAEQLEDLEAIVATLRLGRLALMGIHRGGPLAVAYAVKYPHKVAHLILYGTYARGAEVAKDEVKASFISLIRAHWGVGSQTLASIYMPDASREELKWFSRFQREAAGAEFTAASMAAVYDIDITELLPEVQVPTLVMHRRRDKVFPFRQGRELAATIPNARFVPLDGDVHAPALGDSESVLRTIGEFLGDPIATASTRQLMTVMFTDIVGSTERAATLGDRRWQELLERHHALVRRELSRFQGREIDVAGDGFFAAFDKPTQAIKCACTIHEAIRDLGIEVRVGLHMGECETAGGAVRGLAVHIGARVAEAAAAGETLVSSTVRDTLAGSEIRLQDRGSRVLKGVPEDWHLFAVEPDSVS
jgi:class 3 adenylate cyclase